MRGSIVELDFRGVGYDPDVICAAVGQRIEVHGAAIVIVVYYPAPVRKTLGGVEVDGGGARIDVIGLKGVADALCGICRLAVVVLVALLELFADRPDADRAADADETTGNA